MNFWKTIIKEAEPIFFSDIVIKRITKSAVNQQLKKLCDEGKLQKYENGIYYLPKKSRLKTNVGVNADTVARYKYVSRGGKVDGFYSGNTFANFQRRFPIKLRLLAITWRQKYEKFQYEGSFIIWENPSISKVLWYSPLMFNEYSTCGVINWAIFPHPFPVWHH